MSFKAAGGVHPGDRKAPANSRASAPGALPVQVVVPMSLHIGAPCSPTVEVGSEVKMGQKIGDSGSPVSAPIHSPVSGKVLKIEPRAHSNGSMVNSVVIENDGLDTPCETIVPRSEAQVAELDSDAIVAIIREAGIVGMGGATFPTAFKISSGKGQVNTVIINGAECEPYITSDHRTMLEHPAEMLKGIAMIMRACGVEKSSFAIEDNKPDAIELLKKSGAKELGIEILSLPCQYPQGAEKQLVYTVTGKEIPPGGLPAAVGCAVFNAFTAYAVYRAVYEGMPSIERVITVSGSAIAEPKNLITRIGTPISHVFEQAGGFVKEPKKILMGGPMMGNAMYNLEVPTTKGTNALLAFCEDEDQTVKNPTCIRCGRCAEACPMRLLPMYLYMFEQKSDFENMDRYHLMDCIECGACTYACPGKLHLTHSCRTGKAKIQAKAAADKARAEAERAANEEKGGAK